ncbi:MAG: ferredoxin [Acidobacteria bacterium]|nr:ferredoxin [Acidobacteriota bacterium]
MSELLHIDWTKCDGRGLCTELLPNVLGRDEWGYPLARRRGTSDRTNVVISTNDAEAARDAVKLCPKLALSLGAQRSA